MSEKESFKFPELNPVREIEIKRCFEEAWASNPNGLKSNAYLDFLACEKNRNIPAEKLRDKYIEYVNSLLPYQSENPKYPTRKDKEIKTMVDFIHDRMYIQEFKKPSQRNEKRDRYLYG